MCQIERSLVNNKKRIVSGQKWMHLLLTDYDNCILYVKVKLATIVEGDPKAPFSIATTPRCWGGRYSIPRIAPLYPWTVPYNGWGVKARWYQVPFLKSLVWLDLGLNPGLPGHVPVCKSFIFSKNYLFTQPFRYKKDVTQGRFLSRVQQVWIWVFIFLDWLPYQSFKKSAQLFPQ